MSFKKPSRRSDLQSLCYFIIFMLNDLKFPLLDDKKEFRKSMSMDKCYKMMKSFKEQVSLSDLIEASSLESNLKIQIKKFFRMIEKLDYEEKPNYKKLYGELERC